MRDIGMAFFSGFIIGVAFMTTVAVLTMKPNSEIINQKCAEYNGTTGKLQWIEEVK